MATDLMHRTGIAPQGDDGGCRWIALSHDQESIHVVAVLARQDGGRAHPSFDHKRVREACLAAEMRYGLASTAPADGTNAAHTSRAETEKAARRAGEPARDRLRRESGRPLPPRAWRTSSPGYRPRGSGSALGTAPDQGRSRC